MIPAYVPGQEGASPTSVQNVVNIAVTVTYMARSDNVNFFARWLLGCLLTYSGICSALEGGQGPALQKAQTPFNSMGSLSVNGKLFSAVLIGPQHVLTAAHIVAGADASKTVFHSGLAGGITLAAERITVHPEFTGQTVGNSQGDPSMHADLAVIKLARPAQMPLRPASFWTGPMLGRVLLLVSHGASMTMMTLGENRADFIFPGKTGLPATYVFDFDGPDLSSNIFGPAVLSNGTLGVMREATLIQGDSGSAAFVNINAQFFLAGINTFKFDVGRNRGAGGVVISSYRAWIENTLKEEPRMPLAPPDKAAESKSPIPPLKIPFKL